MTSSRRKLLATAALLVSGAASWALLRARKSLSPAIPPAPVPPSALAAKPPQLDSSLTQRTHQTLRAAVRWAIGHDVDLAGYDEYFAWRSKHVPGAGMSYERLGAMAEVNAHGEQAASFAACDEAQRGRVLTRLFASSANQPVREEILRRYSRTEAWIALGYDAWPGTPRGLTDYLQPISPPAASTPNARGG